ncbi:uncharacterized protein [Haliotis asinina]|uniref:uncharacterized protein n=1 Tax=Haliotis asinina TaxID=109174 RepID=UPI003531A13A
MSSWFLFIMAMVFAPCTPQESTSITRETVTTLLASFSTTQETVTTPQESTSITRETVTTLLASFSTTQETVTTPQGSPSITQETVTTPQGSPSITQEPVITPQGGPSTSRETATTPRASLSRELADQGDEILTVVLETEEQCNAMCVYARPCLTYCWQNQTRVCQLKDARRESVCRLEQGWEYRTMDIARIRANHPCGGRPCRTMEMCTPVTSGLLCLPLGSSNADTTTTDKPRTHTQGSISTDRSTTSRSDDETTATNYSINNHDAISTESYRERNEETEIDYGDDSTT